jgi:hypothetical protein
MIYGEKCLLTAFGDLFTVKQIFWGDYEIAKLTKLFFYTEVTEMIKSTYLQAKRTLVLCSKLPVFKHLKTSLVSH